MEFEAKRIVAEKKNDNQALAIFYVLELLNHLGCAEMAMFPSKYNENLVRECYANLLAEIEYSQIHAMVLSR